VSANNFNIALQALLEVRPFQVFTIELHGVRRFEIDYPGAIKLINGIVVIRSPGGIPILFDRESVNLIAAAPAIDVPNGPHQ
jgi:hypothetical protein